MRHEFFAGRWWKGLYLMNGVVMLALGLTNVVGQASWWRVLIGVIPTAFGVWNLYVWSLAIREPLIAVDDEAVEVRAFPSRISTKVLRSEVGGVAWSNPGSIGLERRAGGTTTVNLIGLSADGKRELLRVLESWGGA